MISYTSKNKKPGIDLYLLELSSLYFAKIFCIDSSPSASSSADFESLPSPAFEYNKDAFECSNKGFEYRSEAGDENTAKQEQDKTGHKIHSESLVRMRRGGSENEDAALRIYLSPLRGPNCCQKHLRSSNRHWRRHSSTRFLLLKHY